MENSKFEVNYKFSFALISIWNVLSAYLRIYRICIQK